MPSALRSLHTVAVLSGMPAGDPTRPRKVAVIGAGASGLVCANECRRQGHQVVVFERAERIGGTWAVDPVPQELRKMNILRQESRRLSAGVHSSMYDNLRTNLPREVMGFEELPFDQNFPGSKDPRQFCGHQEVLRYLEAYTDRFRLGSAVRFGSTVTRVTPVEGKEFKWDVEVVARGHCEALKFDAVAVCNGHYSLPHVPEIANIGAFNRPILHSHLYRNASPFAGQTVVILGNASSGNDVAQEVGEVAQAVYHSARRWKPHLDLSRPTGRRHNVHRTPVIDRCTGEGQLQLADGSVLSNVDALILCTGYEYAFPFLDEANLFQTTPKGIVYPLYKNLVHPRFPTLFVLAVQFHILPFFLAQYQSKLLARIVAGRCRLPSADEMMAEIDKSIEAFGARNQTMECDRVA